MDQPLTIDQIKSGLERPGKSKGGLAKALGIHQSGVSTLFKPVKKTGKPRGISADEERIIRRYLELDQQIPIVGFVAASSGEEEVFYGENSDNPDDYEPADPDAPPQTVAVEIRGFSLGAGLNGWLAYYNDRREPVTPDLLGHLCVIGLPNGKVLIKVPRPAPGGKYHLHPNAGGEIVTDAEVAWAAKVIDLKPRSER